MRTWGDITYYADGHIWKEDLNEGEFQMFKVVYLKVWSVSVKNFLRYINQ